MDVHDIDPSMKQQEEKKYYTQKKPWLISRYGEMILDALVFILLTYLLFFVGQSTLYEPLGRNAAENEAMTMLRESNLYANRENGGLIERNTEEGYDENLSPEQNLEYNVLYFYTNSDYAISHQKLDDFFASKNASDLFVRIQEGTYDLPKGSTVATIESWMVAHYERAAVPESAIRKWCEDAYTDAVYFLEHNPLYVTNINRTGFVDYFVLLLAEVVAWGIYYVMIPLLLPKRKTLFKLVFRMAVLDKKTDGNPKPWQIVVRSLALLLLCIVLPTTWYFFIGNGIGYLAMLFPAAEILLMGVTKANTSIHDLLSQTYVVSTQKSASDILLEQEEK